MRPNALVPFALALGLASLLGVLAPAAAAAQLVTTGETRLTSSPGDDYDPAIFGDTVVYTSNRTASTDVFYFDLATATEHQVTAAPMDQELADVWNGRIALTDLSNADVVVHELASGTVRNLTAPANSIGLNPALSDKLVAWEDRRDGNFEIYAENLETGEQRRLSANAHPDGRPAVSGTRVVWQGCPLACDIFVYDWADGSTRRLTNTPTTEQLPDISGDWVVYQALREGEQDIFAFNLATGIETRLSRPGVQVNANVSGTFVAFEEVAADGYYHVFLWDLRTGESVMITGSAGGGQYLNDIYATGENGGRLVYTDDREGQLDVYMTAFRVTCPDAAVAQTEYNYGQVALGLSSSALFTITNPGSAPLQVSWSVDNPAFNATGITAAQIEPGQSFDIPVTFVPAALGVTSGTLSIATNVPGRERIDVALTGEGVRGEAPVEVEISELLAFYNTALSSDPPTLVGIGPGKSAANRANALRNMIEATGDLISEEKYAEAASQLGDISAKCDGLSEPPDFVTGDAREAFASRVQALMDRIK